GRDVDMGVGDVRTQALGHHDADLGKNGIGGRLQGRVLDALEHARADRDRFDLVDGEHQRRQVEALAQHVADAGRALDRHAAGLQGSDVAIDRARGDLELLGQRRRGHRFPGATQGLDDVEKAVRTGHVTADITLSGGVFYLPGVPFEERPMTIEISTPTVPALSKFAGRNNVPASAVVRAGDWVFVSGMPPVNPETGGYDI